MITSQTLGTTLHPISAGGGRVDHAVALVRAAALRRKSDLDLELLREYGADEAITLLTQAVRECE
jgi:hypothetical protein